MKSDCTRWQKWKATRYKVKRRSSDVYAEQSSQNPSYNGQDFKTQKGRPSGFSNIRQILSNSSRNRPTLMTHFPYLKNGFPRTTGQEISLFKSKVWYFCLKNYAVERRSVLGCTNLAFKIHSREIVYMISTLSIKSRGQLAAAEWFDFLLLYLPLPPSYHPNWFIIRRKQPILGCTIRMMVCKMCHVFLCFKTWHRFSIT